MEFELQILDVERNSDPEEEHRLLHGKLWTPPLWNVCIVGTLIYIPTRKWRYCVTTIWTVCSSPRNFLGCEVYWASSTVGCHYTAPEPSAFLSRAERQKVVKPTACFVVLKDNNTNTIAFVSKCPPSHGNVYTQLKMSCYSSITMCQYWDNWLIYWEYTDYFTNMSQ